jgi:DNA-nicking Smr family endonuclease
MSARDRRRVLSREERVLWRTVTQSIAPLRNTPHVASEIENTSDVTPSPAQSRRAVKSVPVPSKAPPASAPPPLAPLGRRMRQRVARGREAIDARFDLHGLTQSEAHAALLHFLRTASVSPMAARARFM